MNESHSFLHPICFHPSSLSLHFITTQLYVYSIYIYSIYIYTLICIYTHTHTYYLANFSRPHCEVTGILWFFKNGVAIIAIPPSWPKISVSSQWTSSDFPQNVVYQHLVNFPELKPGELNPHVCWDKGLMVIHLHLKFTPSRGFPHHPNYKLIFTTPPARSTYPQSIVNSTAIITNFPHWITVRLW